MIKYYKFWCEWDIGCNDSAFISEEVLIKQAKQDLKDCGIEDDIADLIEEGLFGIESHYIVEE